MGSLVLLVLLALAADQPSVHSAERLFELGVTQYRDGEFAAAVFSLDTAIRRLGSGSPVLLAKAQLALGACYVMLQNERIARAKFRRALAADATARLSPEDYPPRVLQVLGSEIAAMTAKRKGRRSGVLTLAGAAAAAGGVGIALASKSPPTTINSAPTVTIQVVPVVDAPTAVPIAAITAVQLTATGIDPNGDPMTYEWDFGDGSSAAGQVITHTYAVQGSYGVSVQVSDGRGGVGSATQTVVVTGLTGTWRENEAPQPSRLFRLVQTGTSVIDIVYIPSGPLVYVEGTLSPPRRFTFLFQGNGPCIGNVDLTGNVIVMARCGWVRNLFRQ